MKALAYPLCLALVVALAVAQNTPSKRSLPIIDMHLHAYTDPQKIGGRIVPPPIFDGVAPRAPAMYAGPGGPLNGTIEKMNQNNIVLGFLSVRSKAALPVWPEAAPDRFLISWHFYEPPDLEWLRAGLAAGTFKGIGEIGSQYSGIAPNDPRLEPYFALAEQFDVPVLIHTAGVGASRAKFRAALGRPLLLEDVLVKHRKLRLYVENAGYPYLDEIIAILARYQNVNADLSTITWIIPRSAFYRYLRALIDAGFEKRLMFGSDQMYWPETIDWAVESIESADFLTPEQKRDIFYHNAARFLRLSEAEIARHHGRTAP